MPHQHHWLIDMIREQVISRSVRTNGTKVNIFAPSSQYHIIQRLATSNMQITTNLEYLMIGMCFREWRG